MSETLTSTPDLKGLATMSPADLHRVATELRSPDLAEALSHIAPSAVARILTALPFDEAVRVFDEPEFSSCRCGVILALSPATAAPFLEAMAGDQRADLVREIPVEDRDRYLQPLSVETRDTLSLLLQYPDDSAGGIMTPEFVAVPNDWTAGQALAYVREVGRDKETVYAVFLVSPTDRHLTGEISLQQLIVADARRPVSELAGTRPPLSVQPHCTRIDVARLVSKYDMLAIAVVDEGHHLLGIVTVDDVIDAMVAEQTRQFQRLGGTEALDAPYSEISFWEMIRKRAGWLCALFIGEMLTATAMGHFEDEIAKAVVLSLFIPLVISSGGNSGSQATSLIIRALALREIKLGDWWRVVLREIPAGLALGTILGVIGFIRIMLWQYIGWYNYGPHYALVAVAVGTSLVGVVTFGSVAGSMLPFLIRRLGFDPASASAPFVATLVDVTGLIIYFTVALVILRGALL